MVLLKTYLNIAKSKGQLAEKAPPASMRSFFFMLLEQHDRKPGFSYSRYYTIQMVR